MSRKTNLFLMATLSTDQKETAHSTAEAQPECSKDKAIHVGAVV
jgi:hypothetical protein